MRIKEEEESLEVSLLLELELAWLFSTRSNFNFVPSCFPEGKGRKEGRESFVSRLFTKNLFLENSSSRFRTMMRN